MLPKNILLNENLRNKIVRALHNALILPGFTFYKLHLNSTISLAPQILKY